MCSLAALCVTLCCANFVDEKQQDKHGWSSEFTSVLAEFSFLFIDTHTCVTTSFQYEGRFGPIKNKSFHVYVCKRYWLSKIFLLDLWTVLTE